MCTPFINCNTYYTEDLRWKSHIKVTARAMHKLSGVGTHQVYCTLRTVCVVCGDFHNSANCPVNKEDPKKKKCENCQENHTASYRGCPIYKEMKDRIRRVTAMRHQYTQNAYTYSLMTTEVYFGTAARSSFGQLNTQKGFSYGLRSGTENRLQPNLENVQQIQVQSVQSMMEFMSFMKTTMQTQDQNQNMVLHLLAAKQSK